MPGLANQEYLKSEAKILQFNRAATARNRKRKEWCLDRQKMRRSPIANALMMSLEISSTQTFIVLKQKIKAETKDKTRK